ncbi:hypothetical protein FisN_18Hu159 [Fistulifera solaris]|uniref:Uncharacterized protein n=1 Tax=Fistulifera solaris TaxID=1519565 RepID=A0A1Z5JVK2_FISSO|nr:hypothetical protein FisN_18Hu159 [Fistulifera solaris]|eukprot:GAX17949.1 hypothetical protein FisN_18Hu159 [Fistulifera solaris]
MASKEALPQPQSEDELKKRVPTDSEWFESFLPKSIVRWTEDQRLDRLQSCRQLDDLLKQCRQKNMERNQLEDFPLGIRMLRYFGWRHKDDPNCVREEHALWACRAVALQCGADLVQLKNCFKDKGDDAILSETRTSYESKSDEDDFSCMDLQRTLGSCVLKKANALARRMDERKHSK